MLLVLSHNPGCLHRHSICVPSELWETHFKLFKFDGNVNCTANASHFLEAKIVQIVLVHFVVIAYHADAIVYECFS